MSTLAGKLAKLSPKQLLVLCFVFSFTGAYVPNSLLDEPPISPSNVHSYAPAIPHLPLPVNLSPLHKSQQNYFSPHGAPRRLLTPAHSPFYGPLVTSHHPATSSRLAKPSMKKSGVVPPSSGSASISPTQPTAGVMPIGLPHPPLSPSESSKMRSDMFIIIYYNLTDILPSFEMADCCKQDTVMKHGSRGCYCVYPIKIDLQLLNVTENANLSLILEEFASQLLLRGSQVELINFYVLDSSRLNISMDIIPHTGIGFSSSDASAINSSVVMHRVSVDHNLVGDYKLLNLTWFEPPAPSEAPNVAPPPKPSPARQPGNSTEQIASNKGKHTNLILILCIGVGILIIAIVSLLIICSRAFQGSNGKVPLKENVSAKPRTVDTAPVVGSLRHPTSTRFLAFEELKEATNNFQSTSILGEGGFGKVFKGVLSDGTAVAIKRLTTGGQQGDKEFLVEVEMLSRLHHRNLVKLVGYYSNRDASQNLLCYELVPNGSLEAWLHGPLGVNCPLDWDTRMKIALDAARGLAYLHEDSQPSVIHRDFKASNILLENNFNAKVADFGLAKQAPEGRANYLSTRVMGTFGYVAPEYAMTGHLLVKSDVYSYGVVLLELLTGRKPVDMAQPSGQENLVTWARPILRDKERLEELADHKLAGKYPKEDFIRVCTIAAACVAPEANQRPTMGEVVQSLKMVQRIAEYQDTMLNPANARPNHRQSSTTFESDGTSSIFSSGPYSGLSALDSESISRTALFSEDLHEGR